MTKESATDESATDAPATDDSPPPPPTSRVKRILVYGGAAVVVLSVVGASLAVVVIKVSKVHDLWCGRVGLLCAKAAPVAPAAVVKPHPVGCPDVKMSGALRGRRPDDPAWTMSADITGRVSLHQADESATGDSSVACFGTQFLATFTGMSDGVTYQCFGAIHGQSYTGVCNLSIAGPDDISGDFKN